MKRPNQKKLNILFLTPRFPYPLIGGDRIKSFFLLKHLAETHNVNLLSFYQGKNLNQEYVNVLSNYGLKVNYVNLHPIKAAASIIPSLFKWPLEIGFYTQPEFKQLFNKLCEQNNFDVIISFFLRTAEYPKNLQNVKKIVVAEDCRTLYQRRSYQNSHNIIQKIVRFWEVLLLKKYEPEIVKYFDVATFVTREDIKAVSKLNPQAKYKILTNGVDLNKYIYKPLASRKNIVFVGKLDLWANELMADKLAKVILPKLNETYPDLKLIVAGACPTRRVKKLASDKVIIHENVPDIIPYYQNARLFIHPHSGATGIQNKLLEAMACGCPVVTTKTGIQGIDVIDGRSVFIGNDDNEIIEKSLLLLKDDALSEKFAQNARKIIEETHSWEVIYQQLDDVIEEVMLKD